MTIFQTIGFCFVVFTSFVGASTVLCFAWVGVEMILRQRLRGQIEESAALRRESEVRAAVDGRVR